MAMRRRRREAANGDAPAVPKCHYIENEGALFRGPARGIPHEVWSSTEKAWKRYSGRVPKPIEWGHIIDEAAAREIMGKSDN